MGEGVCMMVGRAGVGEMLRRSNPKIASESELGKLWNQMISLSGFPAYTAVSPEDRCGELQA
jgi:hypothetical protein